MVYMAGTMPCEKGDAHIAYRQKHSCKGGALRNLLGFLNKVFRALVAPLMVNMLRNDKRSIAQRILDTF